MSNDREGGFFRVTSFGLSASNWDVRRYLSGGKTALLLLWLSAGAASGSGTDVGKCAAMHGAKTNATSAADREAKVQGVSFTIENDVFGAGQTTDRWYTSGLHAAWAYRLDRTPEPLHGWQKFWTDAFDASECATVSSSFGQNIYTPRRIDIATAQPLDRPWAGFLYGGLGAYEFSALRGYHQAVDLKLGVIGPASFGSPVQRGWHHLINAPQPQGWTNQLRPALAAQITYRRTWRYWNAGDFHLHPFAGGTIGNTRTQAVAGATVHFGGGGHLISDGDEGDFAALDFNNRTAERRQFGVYAQLLTKAVFYNRFLTGPSYGQRSEIDITRGVATLSIGAVVELSNRWRVSYALKRRTPEFSSPALNHRDGYQTWGGITLIYDLDVAK